MNILFLCDDNTGLSQMAEGIARVVFENNTNIYSASLKLKKSLNPLAIKVMEEMDINIACYQTKSLREINLSNMDIIINLGTKDSAIKPLDHQKKYYWPLPNPNNVYLTSEEQLNAFYDRRDRLVGNIIRLKQRLNKKTC